MENYYDFSIIGMVRLSIVVYEKWVLPWIPLNNNRKSNREHPKGVGEGGWGSGMGVNEWFKKFKTIFANYNYFSYSKII